MASGDWLMFRLNSRKVLGVDLGASSLLLLK